MTRYSPTAWQASALSIRCAGRRRAHPALSEAMSIENRYFTSDLNIRW